MPIWGRFLSHISWHVPNFRIFEAIFSKPGIDMDTRFQLKFPQNPVLYFYWKKIKNRLIVFFVSKFWENATFDCLVFWYLTSFVNFTKNFMRYLGLQMTPIFSVLSFWASKGFKKLSEYFPIRCPHFSELKTHRETIHQKVRQGCRLVFNHEKFRHQVWRNLHFLIIFLLLSSWAPISQDRDQIQSPWFRKLYKGFIHYVYLRADVQKNFILVFLVKICNS